MSSGRKRKPPGQAKQLLLQSKKSKVLNEAVEDIDTATEYTRNVKLGLETDLADDQTNLEKLEDRRRDGGEKDDLEIENKIKEDIVEDFTKIQIAVNNALGMKNKELECKDEALNKLINERKDLVKTLQEIDSELREREDDVKRQEEEIKTLKTSLKDARNLKSKKIENDKKENKEIMDKLTKNVEHLTKINIELAKENKTLKEAVHNQENVIKKCHDDFKVFGEKVDEFKYSRDITINNYRKELADKEVKMNELELQRLHQTKELKESLETAESEKLKILKSWRETKENRKEDIKIKDDALKNMQKLINAEKKVNKVYKQELIQKDHEINVKSEVARQYKEEINRLKANNAELSSKMERHMKKSHERKIKLKSAQQSYRSNLNEFMDKYQKDIEYLKNRQGKEKLREKKILKVKSMKLILGENSTENALSRDLKSSARVAEKSTAIHSEKQEFESVKEEPAQDVQPGNEECKEELENENFTSFILWDESAFPADHRIKANQEKLKLRIGPEIASKDVTSFNGQNNLDERAENKNKQYDTTTQETMDETVNDAKNFVDELIDSILISSLSPSTPNLHDDKNVKIELNDKHDSVDEAIEMILSCVIEHATVYRTSQDNLE